MEHGSLWDESQGELNQDCSLPTSNVLTMYINSINFYKIILKGKGLDINNPISNSQTVLWVCNKHQGLASTLECNGPCLPRPYLNPLQQSTWPRQHADLAEQGHSSFFLSCPWREFCANGSEAPPWKVRASLHRVSWDNGSGIAQLQVGVPYAIPFLTPGQPRHHLSFCF